MIARIWRGWTAREDAEAYARYMVEIAAPDSLGTPGNRGFFVLHRPDGTPHAEFRREVALSPPGSYRFYRHLESFPMSTLGTFPGRWTLRLQLDDEPAGVYSIDLVDSRARAQRRE